MEFSFKDILHVIRKNIVFMLIVSLVIGVGAYFATKLFIRPTYTSTVKLYVNANSNGKTSYDDINSHNYAQKMVATYIEILNTNSFRNEVAKELPDNYSAAFLKQAISYSEVTDTEVFSATVSCADPIEAKTVADAVADYLPPMKFDGDSCSYKKDDRKYTWQEVHRIASLLPGDYDSNKVCALLSIVTGEEWDYGTINGCCQSDWQYVFYPVARYDRAALNVLEAEYFNTGTEWLVHDSDEPVEDADDVEGYTVYITDYDEKRGLAEAIGCSEDELVLFEYTGMKQVPTWSKAS